jgi:multidrug efflux pump subunit AcrA (membrane-fusion protein)
MFADVSILAQENKGTVLAPISAIVFDGTNPTAFVVNPDNTVELRTLTTGLQNNTQIEILSGLKPGDLVVTIGQPNLIDGAKVEVASDPRIAE